MSTARRLAKFNVEQLLAPHPPRTNLYVANLDGRFGLRIAQIRDTFPAHRHPNGDEGWFIYRGRLRIDSEIGSVELSQGEGVVLPRGVRHSPTCLEDGTIVLVMNARDLATVPDDAGALTASGYTEVDAHGPLAGEPEVTR